MDEIAIMMRTNKNEPGSMNINRGVESWLDETLSEKDCADQARLLSEHWSDVIGRTNLTPIQRAGHHLVLQYLSIRIGIMNRLSLVQADPQGNTAERLNEISEEKLEVLEIVSHKRFAEYLKSFGIGEEHPLSPTRLFCAEMADDEAEALGLQASCKPSQVLPHYTSPWKNAILLALLAEGLDAGYAKIADYIATNFPFVERPGVMADHKKESIDYLVGRTPDKNGIPTPNYPEINAQFQRDRSRIKADLQKYLRALGDSQGKL